uniref:Uncharacterized protein n=1 Tax=Gadus morhua TaxID=8049 RepID=A0A8C4Z1Q8_GADMO
MGPDHHSAPAKIIQSKLPSTLGEIGVQLVLLVDALLLDAVPALLLGHAQSAGDVVAKVQPLLLGPAPPLTSLQVPDGLVIVLQLQVALAKEEVGLDRLAVQLQGVLAVGQRLVVLLELDVAQRAVGVVHRHRRVDSAGDTTHDSLAVAGGRLLVLAAEEEAVPLLLELLGCGALLRAGRHLLHSLRGARSALLPDPVPRVSGSLAGRWTNAPAAYKLGPHRARDGVKLRFPNRGATQGGFSRSQGVHEGEWYYVFLYL